MTHLLAAQTAMTMSPIKPLLVLAALGAWGWFASTRIDKWLEFHFFPREAWNGALVGTAVLGLLLVLYVPLFLIGLPLLLLCLGGGILGYISFHNSRVRPEYRIQWNLGQMLEERKKDAAIARARKQTTLRILEPDGRERELPQPGEPAADAHAKLQTILTYALPRGAERLVLAINNQKAVVLVHVDGVRFQLPSFSPRLGAALMDYLKEHAGLDTEERRRRQSGATHVSLKDMGRHELAITTVGSTRELTLTALIDPAKALMRNLTELGLLGSQVEQLRKVIETPGGVVLAAAPPRQGQTTTLYSLLSAHDAYMQSVLTLEYEIEHHLEGINHNQLDPKDDADAVIKKLQAMFRQDPNVVMLPSLPDARVAKTIAQQAEETRFYVGVRADDALTAVKGWLKAMGDERELAAGSLAAVVCQRLVRLLCSKCRTPYRPDAKVLKKLNISAEKAGHFYKHSGRIVVDKKTQTCPACHGLGYRGRTGVFELMIFDDAARRLLARGDLDELRTHLRRQKMLQLQEAGIFKVVEGATSISEINRAMGKDADQPVAVSASTLGEEG